MGCTTGPCSSARQYTCPCSNISARQCRACPTALGLAPCCCRGLQGGLSTLTLIHRSSEMHEATRRVLGVLLRQMDGFAQGSRTVVLGATNRKQDLDTALLSRFDASIAFQLPSASTRYPPGLLHQAAWSAAVSRQTMHALLQSICRHMAGGSAALLQTRLSTGPVHVI